MAPQTITIDTSKYEELLAFQVLYEGVQEVLTGGAEEAASIEELRQKLSA